MTPHPGSLFIIASLGRGYFFITETPQMWQVAMHGADQIVFG